MLEDRYSHYSNEQSRHSDCLYHQLVKANTHKRCAFTPPPESPARLICSQAQDQEFVATTQGCWHRWSDGNILKTNWSPLAFIMSVSELSGTKGTPYNSIHLTGKQFNMHAASQTVGSLKGREVTEPHLSKRDYPTNTDPWQGTWLEPRCMGHFPRGNLWLLIWKGLW